MTDAAQPAGPQSANPPTVNPQPINPWYYALGQQRLGPVEQPQFFDLIAAGQVRPETLVWRPGWADWKEARLAPELAGFLSAAGMRAAPPTMAGPVAMHSVGGYAGFWLRFAALLIDGLIVGAAGQALGCLVIGPLGALMGASGARGGRPSPALVGTTIGAALLLNGIQIVGAWLYSAMMESSAKQATLGKMALGIRVTTMEGERISFGRATGRYFGKWISGIILCIGYIMAGFTEKKQALHDMMAGTLVVKSR